MNHRFEYIDTQAFSGFANIEVTDVIGLVRLAEANHIKFVFRTGMQDKEKAPDTFFFPLNNTLFIIKANDYLLLDDYYNSQIKKFPTALEYYEAMKNGYDSYEEYKHSKNTGNNSENKEDFEKAKTRGFVKNFDTFIKKLEKYKLNNRLIIPENKTTNPVLICEFAATKGFDSYHEFEKAYDAGYPDKSIYTEASSKGYKTAENFFDAITKGFTLPADYELAMSKRMANKKELDDYRFLKSGNFKNFSFDEYHLLMLMREYENGKKFTIDELMELLTSEQERYKRNFAGSDKAILPVWYIQTINTPEKFHHFMCNNEEIKKMGTYNAEKKHFEIFHISRTKVFVDASNVAYNSRTDKSRNPQYKNIRLVLQELHVWKFKDIVVIADASLRHHAKDSDEMQQIKRLADFYEAPSKTQADEFLLKAIHRHKCIVVSNDTFSDWQKKDDWLRQNVDKLRIPFIIDKEGHVSMANLDRVINENEK